MNQKFDTKKQMLDLMSAIKLVLDTRLNGDLVPSTDVAFTKLQHEYVQAIVLLKAIENTDNIPALLKAPGQTSQFTRQIFSMNESLSVALGDK